MDETYTEIIDCCINIRQCAEDIQSKINYYQLLHKEFEEFGYKVKEPEQILKLVEEAQKQLNEAADLLFGNMSK